MNRKLRGIFNSAQKEICVNQMGAYVLVFEIDVYMNQTLYEIELCLYISVFQLHVWN